MNKSRLISFFRKLGTGTDSTETILELKSCGTDQSLRRAMKKSFHCKYIYNLNYGKMFFSIWYNILQNIEFLGTSFTHSAQVVTEMFHSQHNYRT